MARTMLCIVEVKTRTAHDMTPAEVAVDWHKRAILRRWRAATCANCPAEMPPVRFDVISVYLVPGEKPEIVHFETPSAGTRMTGGTRLLSEDQPFASSNSSCQAIWMASSLTRWIWPGRRRSLPARSRSGADR